MAIMNLFLINTVEMLILLVTIRVAWLVLL